MMFRISPNILLLPLLTSCFLDSNAQYAPKAGTIGSTAIHKDSSVFKSWASACQVVRGYQNVANPSAGMASAGDDLAALGKAGANGVVSLGDGGTATLAFTKPIANGIGFDFAVFENGFAEMGTPYDFLEYAFVEVSSDGKRFVQFPARYAGNTSKQVDSFEPTDTRLYHNLAGKYTAGYGTPFDLEELKDSAGLNLENITHIRIVDIVGNVNPSYASHDIDGKVLNDPWPTEFPTSGFDLDAVGVIQEASNTGLSNEETRIGLKLFPNPATDYLTLNAAQTVDRLEVCDLLGNILAIIHHPRQVDVSGFQRGILVLKCTVNGQTVCRKVLLD
jgi:hypothetical protein